MPANLIRRSNHWYVRVIVPVALRAAVGRREYTKTTGTADLRLAERLKHSIIDQLKYQIEVDAGKTDPSQPAWIHRQAHALRESVQKGELDAELASDMMGLLRDQHIAAGGTVSDSKLAGLHRLSTDLDYLPLNRLAEKYLDQRKPKVTASTHHKMSVTLKAFGKWLGEGKDISDIDRKATGAYVSDVLQQSNTSTATQLLHIGMLNAFMNWAKRKGLYDHENPWTGLGEDVRDSKRGGNTRTRRPWSQDELKVIDTIPGDDPMHPLLHIAQWSGMRLNEITGLKLEDVDLDNHMLVITEGKTESAVRQVPIHPSITDTVTKWYSKSSDGYLVSGLKVGGLDSKRGHAIGKRIGRWIRANVSTDPGVVFHSLRNTFMHRCERAGIPESTTQLIVGHSRQSLTYGLYSPGVGFEVLREAVSGLKV